MAAEVEYIDHTADVGIRVRADTATDAFAAAAESMFDIMLNREAVSEAHTWQVSADAEGWEDLLVAFLEELLYRYEMQREVPRHVHIHDLTPQHITAQTRGDYLDPARHEPDVQIKAVTYHQLRAAERDGRFEVSVIFDI